MGGFARWFTFGLVASLFAMMVLPDLAEAQRRRRRRGRAAQIQRQRARARAQARARRQRREDPAEQRRILIEEFGGPRAQSVRGVVVRALREDGGFDLVPVEEANATAERIGVDPTSEDGRAAVAREHEIAAVIEGRVRRGRQWRVTVTVYNGADMSVLAEEEWSSRRPASLDRQVGSDILARIGDALRNAQAPPPQPDEPEPRITRREGGEEPPEGPAETEEPGETETWSAGPTPPWSDTAIGVKFFSRSLSWNDDLFGALRAYELGGAPALVVSTTWYPGAHFSEGIVGSIGLAFDLEHAFAVESTTSDGERFPTTELAWAFGLRGRFALGPATVLPLVQYGGHVYAIDPAGPGNPRPAIPDVSYRFVRAGLGGRMELIPEFVLHVDLAYLFVSEAGEIISELYFPHGEVGGVEVAVGASYRVTGPLWVEVGFDVRRYFFTMNPVPGDLWVAGGAVDQYLGARFGLAIRPGSGE